MTTNFDYASQDGALTIATLNWKTVNTWAVVAFTIFDCITDSFMGMVNSHLISYSHRVIMPLVITQ